MSVFFWTASVLTAGLFLLLFMNFTVSASKTCVFFTSFLDGNPYLCLSSLPFPTMEDVFYFLSSSKPLRWAVIYHLPYPDRQVATLTKVRRRGDVYVHLFI